MEVHAALSWLDRLWRWIRWRTVLVAVIWAMAFLCFELGVGCSLIRGVPEAGWRVHAYYAACLFTLGGDNIGFPTGGPALARATMWFVYAAAPVVAVGTLVEGVARMVNPRDWALKRLRNHFVIAGCGKLTMQYLARLRARHPGRPVVIVETKSDAPYIKEAREAYGALVITGDILSPALLERLQLDHAARVLMFTDDDFANLDAATRALSLAPKLAGRMTVHLTDLHFMRVVERTPLAARCELFNTHQIAAEYLVKSKLLARFKETEPLDTVVLAGFGRFGQTVLDELQTLAAERFDRVVMVDLDCKSKVLSFEEHVGFRGDYQREIIEGDLRDPEVWQGLDKHLGLREKAPVFVVGSGDDGLNLHTALWLAEKYPEGMVVARTFRQSSFGEQMSKDVGFELFCVGELLSHSMPDSWLD
jgi:hypothetical protein